MIIRHLLAIVCGFVFFANSAYATFLPPEEIDYEALKFYPEAADMTEGEFNAIVDKVTNIYRPIVAAHRGKLVVRADWESEELNASAMQLFGNWYVNMYGGLARFALMTHDGFAMVMCHEIGHHLGGFAFVNGPGLFGGVWAASEGQSDYFATQVCAKKIWQDEPEINATFRGHINDYAAQQCDAVYTTVEEQNICYRTAAAGESLAASLNALRKDKDPEPNFETPDENKVSQNYEKHPRAQCRMDTYLQGALCNHPFDDKLIPGKKKSDKFGLEAERESALVSCTDLSGYGVGLRPNCWFFPRM